AEDGIRAKLVTGVQTCALPILPLDPPFADRATIGGLLATNDSGPLRHRYGTPRDLVIGIQLATTDGVLAKAGGQVVKNVAGYDQIGRASCRERVWVGVGAEWVG